jgi:hypothetical protein
MAKVGTGVLVACFAISTALTIGAAMPPAGMGGGRMGETRSPAKAGIGMTGPASSGPRQGLAVGGIGPTRSETWHARQSRDAGLSSPQHKARTSAPARAQATALVNHLHAQTKTDRKTDRVRSGEPVQPDHRAPFGGQPFAAPRVGSGTGMGWSGSVFWPEASGDIQGYLFAPRSFGGSFWTFAYDDVFAGIFWPPAYTPPGNGRADQTEGLGRTADESRLAALSPELSRICDDQASGLPHWSFDRIGPALQLTEAQKALLDQVSNASEKAAQTLRPSCPSETPPTATGRLETMRGRIGALLEAIDLVGTPLKEFYGSLSDEQKARFNRLVSSNTGGRHGDALARSLGLGESRGTVKGCRDEPPPGYSDRIIQHVERVVHPIGSQRSALDDLRIASATAAKGLQAACTADKPLALSTRLDGVRQRLDGALRAVNTIAPALTRFYDLLSGEQKERFDSMTAQGG